MVTANWSSCLDHLEKHHFLIKNHFGHFLKNIGLILIPSTGHTVKNVLITLGSLSRVFKQRFLSVRGPMEKVMEVEFNKFLLLNQDNKLKRIAFCQRERERERDRVCVCWGSCVCVGECVCVWVSEWECVCVHMHMSKVRLREDGARERFREIMRMFFAWVAKQDECFPRACLRKKRIIRERDKDRFFRFRIQLSQKRSNPGLSRWPQRQIRHRILRR